MTPSSKKIVGGVIALLFIVTIVQSAAISEVAKKINTDTERVAVSYRTENQQAAVSKSYTAPKTDSGANLSTDIATINKIETDKGNIKRNDTDLTIICTPSGCNNGITLPYTFLHNDTVGLTYCAGGGGGGGGGRGMGDYEDNMTIQNPAGGGGGGGGKAGQCHSYKGIGVQAGQTFNANIGVGGNGGVGAFSSDSYTINPLAVVNPQFVSFHALAGIDIHNLFFVDFQSSTETNPVAGSNGTNTLISITGGVYPQADGGSGGQPGTSAGYNGSYPDIGLGGAGGNPILPDVWHDGVNGTVGSWPYGGQGGDGESPAAGNATIYSAGGGGGTDDTYLDNSNAGFAGQPSFGGGAGSGGFGLPLENYGCGNGPDIEEGHVPMVTIPNPADPFGIFGWIPDTITIPAPNSYPAPMDLYYDLCRVQKGGNGEKGGDGYIIISGINTVAPTEIIYDAPGTYPFSWTNVPPGVTATIKVWGAGGGGGRAHENSSTATEDIQAGGGGAGGYVETTMVSPGSGSYTITVGAGGAAGAVGGGNNGAAGGQSKFGVMFIASGGAGGLGDFEGIQSPGGAGGAGGAAFGGNTNIPGIAGQNGVAGGLGGNMVTPQNNISDGGAGGVIDNLLGGYNLVSRSPVAGKPGKVVIDW